MAMQNLKIFPGASPPCPYQGAIGGFKNISAGLPPCARNTASLRHIFLYT